jgi:hypothetical protein
MNIHQRYFTNYSIQYQRQSLDGWFSSKLPGLLVLFFFCFFFLAFPPLLLFRAGTLYELVFCRFIYAEDSALVSLDTGMIDNKVAGIQISALTTIVLVMLAMVNTFLGGEGAARTF